MRIALASDAWTPQVNGVVMTLKATAATLTDLGHEVRVIRPQGLCLSVPGALDVIEPGVSGMLHEDLATAIGGALRLSGQGCAARTRAFGWEAASAQVLAGLAPIPTALRATLAVSRSSAMIARRAARRQPSRAGDAN